MAAGCRSACTWAKLAMLDGVDDMLLLAEVSCGVQVNLHADDFTLAAAGRTETEVYAAARAIASSFWLRPGRGGRRW